MGAAVAPMSRRSSTEMVCASATILGGRKGEFNNSATLMKGKGSSSVSETRMTSDLAMSVCSTDSWCNSSAIMLSSSEMESFKPLKREAEICSDPRGVGVGVGSSFKGGSTNDEYFSCVDFRFSA